MNCNCELIQDLLPLYQEGLCSPTSRQVVEAHLRECGRCRALTAPLPIREPEDTPAADRAVTKSIRKVKRRWLTSLIAAALLFPMLLLGFNQYRGSGLCFTNLDDAFTAWRFLHALERQDWQTAAALHDFSDDYHSIREALAMEVSDWGPSFIPFDLAGHDYAAKSSVTVPETIQDLYGFLYNRSGFAMVPLSIWEQLMALDPDAFYREGSQYWLNGEPYGKIATPWGEFVTSEGRSFDTAHDYARHFDLIPAAVYEEARPAIEAEARQLYETTHAHIGWVAELTEEEFTREMIRRYTDDLHSLQGSVTFDCTSLRSIHRMTESWYVIFNVTITQNGRQLDTQLDLRVEDGRILVAGISHQPGSTWLDAIDRVLYPSAHPEY